MRSWVGVFAAAAMAMSLTAVATGTADADATSATEECRVSAPGTTKQLANEPASKRRAKAEVVRRVEKRFTKFSAANRFGQLNRGLIGVVVTSPERVVVVVDPQKVDPQKTERAVSPPVPAGKQPPVRVEARAGCFSVKELIEARRVLEARDWHPRADEVPFGFFLRAEDSRFVVTINDREVAEALSDRLGDRVVIQASDPGQPAAGNSATQNAEDDRSDDRAPFYGGAELADPGATSLFGNEPPDVTNPDCTSGFAIEYTLTLENPDNPEDAPIRAGERGLMSAGHCFDDGLIARTVDDGDDASVVIGTAYESVIPGLPVPDLDAGHDGVIIDNGPDGAEGDYAARIYTNPRADLSDTPTDIDPEGGLDPISSRQVVGQYNYGLVEYVLNPDLEFCISGRLSGNTCNAQVGTDDLRPGLPPAFEDGSITSAFCFGGVPFPEPAALVDEGCVFNLLRLGFVPDENPTTPTDTQLVTSGDSGGPVYACVDNQADLAPNESIDIDCADPGDQAKIVGLISFNDIPDLQVVGVGIQRVCDLQAFYPFTVAGTAASAGTDLNLSDGPCLPDL